MSLYLTVRALAAALALGACATVPVQPFVPEIPDGWTPVTAVVRPVGLGLLPGARLAPGVRFAGGIEIDADPASPLHSLSDLKIINGDLFSVSDAGDLVQAHLRLGPRGRLTSIDAPRLRRLTLMDGSPITDKTDGDAEGLTITASGELLISFERRHRIWNYGPPTTPVGSPTAVASPNYAFPNNTGMEGLAAAPGGWRVAGEGGGVWDCAPAGCVTVIAPPEPPLADTEYRITGLDLDPTRDGWFVIQRRFREPADIRARIRHMSVDGSLGPVLVELKHPGTVDNFEGIAAVAGASATRIYILSDDNFSARQRTLLLAFDLNPARRVRPFPTP
ncbi:esterase-like activity of phytase family protein [uncultured Brevundimonas sp.]|uniref:esterase-like activity of phytase family protein n=1 Tax=uncultured Brevundimonas sp. TaxID=213418 RepID=UPI0030EEEC41|tara:strand:+ start:667 stop:1668 length:1002 start_codon:yes stop_codon:yes gene_type:complete